MSTAFYTVLLAARSRSISTLRPPKYSVSTGAEMLDLGCFGHAFLKTDAGKWECLLVSEFLRLRFEIPIQRNKRRKKRAAPVGCAFDEVVRRRREIPGEFPAYFRPDSLQGTARLHRGIN